VRKLTAFLSKVFLFDDRTCVPVPPNYLLPVFPGPLTFISARAEFDEGHLMTDMAAAEREVDLMLEIIDGSKRTEQSEDPVRYMFTDICDVVRKVSSSTIISVIFRCHCIANSSSLPEFISEYTPSSHKPPLPC
jgi:hypothetical protein